MTLVVTTVAAYLVWVVAAWVIQESIIFPRGYAGPATADAPRGVETLWIDLVGGERVEAWLAVPEAASPARPAPLVVFFHGNAELIEHNADLLATYRDAGLAALMVEYRGYGRSGGRPSERGIVEDALAAIGRVASRPEIDGDRLILHGRSLGGGLAAQVAAARPPAGLVLESTFVSVRRMLGRYLLPPFVARHPMRTDLVLRSYGGPVLVLHGRRDSIIPFEHGRRLSEMSDRATLVPTDSGHNDLVGDWTWYTGELLSFAEGAVSSGPRTDAPSAGSGAPAPSSPSGSRP